MVKGEKGLGKQPISPLPAPGYLLTKRSNSSFSGLVAQVVVLGREFPAPHIFGGPPFLRNTRPSRRAARRKAKHLKPGGQAESQKYLRKFTPTYGGAGGPSLIPGPGSQETGEGTLSSMASIGSFFREVNYRVPIGSAPPI